jgi:polyisoprenoid-binding protein YceI
MWPIRDLDGSRGKVFALLLALAFSVPDRAADAPLDSKLTSIKFTGHAFLHSFEGQAQDFEGGAQIDPANPNYVTDAVIDLAAARLTTFQTTRDRNMKKWLDAPANPRIEYRLEKIECVSGIPVEATRAHPATFTVQGDFTLNRTTRPVTAAVTGWREKGLLIVTGTTTLDTTDYGLPIIRQMFMTVDKDVQVSFRLVFDLPAGP